MSFSLLSCTRYNYRNTQRIQDKSKEKYRKHATKRKTYRRQGRCGTNNRRVTAQLKGHRATVGGGREGEVRENGGLRRGSRLESKVTNTTVDSRKCALNNTGAQGNLGSIHELRAPSHEGGNLNSQRTFAKLKGRLGPREADVHHAPSALRHCRARWPPLGCPFGSGHQLTF
ncbi:uncharacterized protein EI90DRAFT_3085006, partial [Cantharellus anzutake]|uniref:uncharacterized protein n=1 Tax=Cantharellus anzutake TaxID=1750568 RepID=UPI001907EA1C